jgi:hypothetical protein
MWTIYGGNGFVLQNCPFIISVGAIMVRFVVTVRVVVQVIIVVSYVFVLMLTWRVRQGAFIRLVV